MRNFFAKVGLTLIGLAVPGTAGPLSERYLIEAENGGRHKIFVVRPDGRDWQRLTDMPGQERDPVWSSRRQRVYYCTQFDNNWELVSWDPFTRQLTRLTQNPGSDRDPRVSPDGRWLVFTSDRYGQDELFLLDLDRPEQEAERLTVDQGQNFSPDWAPDGASLVFASRRNGQSDLYQLRLSDRQQTRLTATEQDEVHPRFSPKGDRILFQTVEGRLRAGRLAWLQPADGQTQVLSGLGESVHQGNWSPAGDRLIYLDYRSAFRPASPALLTHSLSDQQTQTATVYRSDWDSAHWSYRRVSWIEWPLHPSARLAPTADGATPPAP